MRDHDSETQARNIIATLKAERIKQGLSHDRLSEMTGLSRPAISYIEGGKRNPTLLSCLKIAKALKLDLGKIISDT